MEHFFSLYLRMQRFDFENSEMIKNHNFCSSQIFFKNGEMMKNVINFSDFLPRTLPPFPLTHHLWRRREQGGSFSSKKIKASKMHLAPWIFSTTFNHLFIPVSNCFYLFLSIQICLYLSLFVLILFISFSSSISTRCYLY